MSRKIVITSCVKCPYMNHSGAFTKGGAWPVCHGPGVVNWSNVNKTLAYNDPEANEKWSPPILPVHEPVGRQYSGVIPDWCPLEKD